MNSTIEVIIPTFVNPHLFWIIQKKDILLRCAIKRSLAAGPKQKEKQPEEGCMVMVHVQDQNIWARGILEKIIVQSYEEQTHLNSTKYLCWLVDYGIMKLVPFVYELHGPCVEFHHLAKQASLYNVVNQTMELAIGPTGCKMINRSTLHEVAGVTRVALDFIETADNLLFCVKGEDEFNLYGDILSDKEGNESESLLKFLVNKNLMAVDEDMFNRLDNTRDHFIDRYFTPSHSWQRNVDETEKMKLKEKLYNVIMNKEFPSEYFLRKAMTPL